MERIITRFISQLIGENNDDGNTRSTCCQTVNPASGNRQYNTCRIKYPTTTAPTGLNSLFILAVYKSTFNKQIQMINL